MLCVAALCTPPLMGARRRRRPRRNPVRVVQTAWSARGAPEMEDLRLQPHSAPALPARLSRREHAVFVIIWRYVVRPELVDDFVAAYGPDGLWAELFNRSPEFIDVELVADDASAGFVTIDR